MTIPDSVTSIGQSVFSGCSKLQYTEYDNAKYLGNENNPYVVLIKSTLYKGYEDITSCSIHTGAKVICCKAFSNCFSLESIEIPDGVTSIGDYAFESCSSLTSIEIPDSVLIIGDGAFRNCGSLTSIEVSANNGAYKSVDGNLYSKDGKELIQYAIGKTATSFGYS